MDLGNDLILIPTTQQNESSYVQGLSWLELAQANKQRYGNPVWRIKDGVEYLIVQCDLPENERNSIAHTIIPLSNYSTHGFDPE
jgi:hypothetical protein